MDIERLPITFIEQIKCLLGEETEQFIQSYAKDETHALRFRSDEIREQLFEGVAKEILEELGLSESDRVSWAPNAFYYDKEKRPGLHPFHEMGLYYIQEPSAMGPAAMLHPHPGERILDLCAAPGGKSTELAYYMRNEGLLVSNEIHPYRSKILASNIERMGIANALVLNEDSSVLANRFPDYFHRVLVDAPCSGEGMFRKNPDAIDEWSSENVKLCAERQAMILDNASVMLMPGGTLVYSTCTFSKEENEDTIAAFLARHPDFYLLEEKRFWPHRERGEGHYMALLRKNGELSDYVYSPQSFGKLDKKKAQLVDEFLDEALSNGKCSLPFETEYGCFGDQIYMIPPQCPDIRGLKVQRAGLHLGEIKKDRFEPAHALALALGREEFRRAFELESVEAAAYLRGEAKHGMELGKKDCGWCVLTYCGYPIGWGKASGNQIKNHYPKGLRKS